jgi:hypothetical protein
VSTGVEQDERTVAEEIVLVLVVERRWVVGAEIVRAQTEGRVPELAPVERGLPGPDHPLRRRERAVASAMVEVEVGVHDPSDVVAVEARAAEPGRGECVGVAERLESRGHRRAEVVGEILEAADVHAGVPQQHAVTGVDGVGHHRQVEGVARGPAGEQQTGVRPDVPAAQCQEPHPRTVAVVFGPMADVTIYHNGH